MSRKLLYIILLISFSALSQNIEPRNLFSRVIGENIKSYATNSKQAYQNNNILKLGTKSSSYGIPFTLGFKYKILDQFIISAEVGSRFMFTDNIDGSVSDDEDYTNFGNINNNDWYVFSLINLSYTFGRKPCYCNY